MAYNAQRAYEAKYSKSVSGQTHSGEENADLGFLRGAGNPNLSFGGDTGIPSVLENPVIEHPAEP